MLFQARCSDVTCEDVGGRGLMFYNASDTSREAKAWRSRADVKEALQLLSSPTCTQIGTSRCHNSQYRCTTLPWPSRLGWDQ